MNLYISPLKANINFRLKFNEKHSYLIFLNIIKKKYFHSIL